MSDNFTANNLDNVSLLDSRIKKKKESILYLEYLKAKIDNSKYTHVHIFIGDSDLSVYKVNAYNEDGVPSSIKRLIEFRLQNYSNPIDMATATIATAEAFDRLFSKAKE